MQAPADVGSGDRPRRAGVVSLIVAVVAVSGLMVSCTSTTGSKQSVTGTWGTTASTRPATTPDPTDPPAAPIAWQSCSGGQCGRLTVPLDGTEGVPAAVGTGGKTMELALLKVPARESSQRIGSLLVNPGGPGASGVDLARQAVRFLPASVLDHFDVIGWDPRGVGASTAVKCGNRLDYLFSGDSSPDDTAEWAALDDVSQRFANACGVRTGAQVLGNISTLATVHDMERIRRSLGEDQITFLGYSYGTELGAMYATLYPGRVRAMVLDGAVDPSLSAVESVTQQAEGLEQGLDQFFAHCSNDESCPIHDDPSGVYSDVRATIEAAPMHVRDNGEDRLLTPSEADVAVAAALYSQSSWPDLARALASAQEGKGQQMLDLFDGYMRRDSDGTYGDEWSAFLAITCLDGPSLGGPTVYPSVEADGHVARTALRRGQRRSRAPVRVLVGPDGGTAAVGVGADRRTDRGDRDAVRPDHADRVVEGARRPARRPGPARRVGATRGTRRSDRGASASTPGRPTTSCISRSPRRTSTAAEPRSSHEYDLTTRQIRRTAWPSCRRS